MGLEHDIDAVLKKTRKPRAPANPHHPKLVAKAIADALKKAKAGKVTIVELRGSTTVGSDFPGVKHSVIQAPWTGHNYIVLEVSPKDEGPYRVAISMSWAEDERPEYSVIPLYRSSTLAGFLHNATSELSSWLGS